MLSRPESNFEGRKEWSTVSVFSLFSFFFFFFVTIGKLMGSRDSSVVTGFTSKSRFCFWGLEVSFDVRLSLLVLTMFGVNS